MKLLSKVLNFLSGQIFIPEKLHNPSVRIMHISDTPSQIYPSIIKLARRLNPDILIHTGDIADDVKLEMLPNRLPCYVNKAKPFLEALSPHVKDGIILVPGNHDKAEMLHLCSNIKIYSEGVKIDLYGITLGLSHKYENLPKECDYYMYGHDKTSVEAENYMNGIGSINIIDISNGDITRLSYPAGTDDYRLRRKKIGI